MCELQCVWIFKKSDNSILLKVFIHLNIDVMVKVYVMESCPDCVEVKARYKDDPGYELVDIGQQARNLKEFLVLRDNHPAFVKVRERGNIGIPCFVWEDGSVIISLKHYEASLTETGKDNGGSGDSVIQTLSDSHVQGLKSAPEYSAGAACNLDGTGC